MTRDERRDACIEAMVDAGNKKTRGHGPSWATMEAAFDSLHGRAAVFDPDVLRTMILSITRASHVPDEIALEMWERMSRTGDLTNPPETKL